MTDTLLNNLDLKEVYFNAGKAVYGENYSYFNCIIDYIKIQNISKNINLSLYVNDEIVIYDKMGAAANSLIKAILSDKISLENDCIYCLSPQCCDEKIDILYVNKLNITIFNTDKPCQCKNIFDVNDCYKISYLKRPASVTARYAHIAEDFFNLADKK